MIRTTPAHITLPRESLTSRDRIELREVALIEMLTNDASTRMQSLLYSSRFFETIRTGILVQDVTGAVIDCNPAAAKLLGLGSRSFGSQEHFDPWHGATREDGTPFLRDELPTTLTLRSGDSQLDVVIGVDLPGQIRRWLSVDTYRLTVDGEIQGIVSAFDDIDTQWHERHLLKLLAEVNRVVMSTSDESESLQHLCTTLVERGPYALAWIGVEGDDDGHTIEVCSSAGAADYLYEGITSSSGDEAIGRGPSGIAMRTGNIQIASDLATDPGFESVAGARGAVRLRLVRGNPIHDRRTARGTLHLRVRGERVRRRDRKRSRSDRQGGGLRRRLRALGPQERVRPRGHHRGDQREALDRARAVGV